MTLSTNIRKLHYRVIRPNRNVFLPILLLFNYKHGKAFWVEVVESHNFSLGVNILYFVYTFLFSLELKLQEEL